MKRSLVAYAPLALVAALAVPSGGCIVGECEDGRDNCVRAESTVEYTGNAADASAAYTSGQGVQIVSHNGQVDVQVGNGDEVEVVFRPFTRNTGDAEGEEAAMAELADKLVLEVTEGNTIQVRVATRDGATSFLGAHIEVTLPSSFDGAFEVSSNNGSVEADLGGSVPASTTVVTDNGSLEVYGARGPLEIEGGNGDVTVSVDEWAGGGTGSIFADNGDIDLTVPSDANGTMTLVASGQIVDEGVPGDKAENDGGTSFTMGDGEGAHVDVTADFGDIAAR
jgi:hypothetical protein